MAGKRSIGTDILGDERPLRPEGDALGQLISMGETREKKPNEMESRGDSRWVKVTVLLRRADVERVRKLQEGLSNNGYGEYTKAEILSFAINNLYIADFPVKKGTGRK